MAARWLAITKLSGGHPEFPGGLFHVLDVAREITRASGHAGDGPWRSARARPLNSERMNEIERATIYHGN